MPATYKQLTSFLVNLGLDQVGHTEKTYLGHLISVYNDLKRWGCDEQVCRGGMFHSIYGTEMFQGFKLPLERRGEVAEMIGDRGERLAYWNCAVLRQTLDDAVERGTAPYWIQDRLTGQKVQLSVDDFDDLCRIHLCDWLEQVPRSQEWNYRRDGFRRMAQRLGGVAQESYERVFGQPGAAEASCEAGQRP